MNNTDCATPHCSGLIFATAPDGKDRCLSCLRAYRDGMAQVPRFTPREADEALAMLVKLVGPVTEPDRPEVKHVTAVDFVPRSSGLDAVTTDKLKEFIARETTKPSLDEKLITAVACAVSTLQPEVCSVEDYEHVIRAALDMPLKPSPAAQSPQARCRGCGGMFPAASLEIGLCGGCL